jgi:hypothetical protein
MRVNITRDIATRLISNLKAADRIAAIQFGSHLELIQDWTADGEQLSRALNTKLISGKRPQLYSGLL